jgi:uncharacterized protein YaaR (DUF327 family)
MIRVGAGGLKPDSKKKGKSVKKKNTTNKSGLFQSLVASEEISQSQDHERVEAIDGFFEALDELGAELRLRQSLGALQNYKDKVRELLSLFANNSHQNLSFFGTGMMGDAKQMQLTKKVDTGLIELTNNVMQKEKDHIAIAASIDNIKGILIDYFK